MDHILDSLPRAVLWFCLVACGVWILFSTGKVANYLANRYGAWLPLLILSVLIFGGMLISFHYWSRS
jgi:hypothetical protein